MRIIDADELQKFPIRLNHYDKEHGNENFVFGIETVLEYAESLPTINPEELRPKGEWIEREYEDERGNYNLFHCSRCDEPNARKKNYCPNCGAKMNTDNI